MKATSDPQPADARRADLAQPGEATPDLDPTTAPPSDVIAQLSELLACTSWRLRRASRSELEPLGLTFGQARALRLLSRAGQPLRIGELAVRLEVVPRSATTTVDALEAAGLVTRQADPADRRSVLVGLTAAGDELLDRLGRARRESAETLFARLDGPQRERLLELLTVLNRRDPAPVTAGRPT